MDKTLLIIIIVILSLVFLLTILLNLKIFDLTKKIREKFKRLLSRNKAQSVIDMITNITSATTYLSDNGHGSIIVVQRKDDVEPLFMDSQILDAKINSNLLINIFSGEESQPLHDGALVIRDGRIAFANAFVKKLTKTKVDKKYGARHRAAFGLSEQCDAIVLITSEERKGVSIAMNGKIKTVGTDKLFDELSEIIVG
ncbi:MAG: DNA integrity scanning protein DisA nucleotide-binding domain protein [Mycoplasmataceae bacterium]|nr:DNA integrity scanning protein DisA nucleotide-binding domain protein [Mycoplasmataceae bacterium]